MGGHGVSLVPTGAVLVTILTTPTTAAPAAPAPRPGAAPELRSEVYEDFTGLSHLRSAWNVLAQACDAPIASSFDYITTWWEHYKGSRKGRIFIFYRGDVLVGAVPVLIETLRTGMMSIRLAKLACSDHVQMTVDPCVRKNECAHVWPEILEHLFKMDRCDGMSFQPIPTDSATRRWLLGPSLNDTDPWAVVRDRRTGCRTIVELGDSFDSYLSALSRNQRSNIRKALRKADELLQSSVVMHRSGGSIREAFAGFVEQHTRQWNAVGKPGHFRDWPGSRSFEDALIARFAANGDARLMSLHDGAHTIAQQYALCWNGTCSCLFAARDIREKYDRIGLGRLSLIKLFAQMIDEGITRADLGLGHYAYQQKLGGGEKDVHSILLCARRSAARRRIHALMRIAFLIDRVYYRLWYQCVRPRLRLRGGRLRTCWIRTRV
jgi:CelD/BcsL family acetyltransferase involved in cellulose biosynthesis